MIRDEKGIGLVEVLAVSAIMVLVLAGAYAYSSFGQRLYHLGAAQADLHASLRLASERIIRELRFAGEVALLEADWDPAAAETEDCSYIYFDSGCRQVLLLNAKGVRPLSEEVVSGLTFSAESAVLLFTMEGEGKSAHFSLDSSVKPLNQKIDIGGLETSQAISFAANISD